MTIVLWKKKQKIKTITKSFHRKVESTTTTTNRWSGNATDFQQDFSQHVDTGLIIYQTINNCYKL